MDRVGAEVILLHMDNRPYADDMSVQKVKDIADRLREKTGHPMPLYSSPHGVSQGLIDRNCDTNYQCVMCKRMMLRVAQEIAKRTDCKAIVTGDSLGQVASQTLRNIKNASQGLEMPVIRPLIGYDKIEIENLAKDIGTYEISVIRSDGCTILPAKPITESDMKKMRIFDENISINDLTNEIADKTIRLS